MHRQIGPFQTSAIGLGCMNLSHAYGMPPPKKEAGLFLNTALDMGYSMLDTAALYGFGANEELIGDTVMHRRHDFVLASKCGMAKNDQGVREINGRPEVIKKTCEDSLRRLKTEVIDLYYLHRWDKSIPIEESVGAMADLRREGKIRTLGLSEVSSSSLKKANAEHPIAAVQTEYSLWTRNAEISILDDCKKMGISFVAFSPLGRGFLTDVVPNPDNFEEKDIRRGMPRFQSKNYVRNVKIAEAFDRLAKHYDMTRAQLSLAWLLNQGEGIIPIPGTTNLNHLKENFSAMDIVLSETTIKELDDLINQETITGPRYNDNTQKEIDTEEFV
ncbi:MAG: aldo/keto reductase [Cellvibrionaceae bacterium]